MTPVFINGRFLAQRLTGIQRFAREVVLGFDRLLADDPVLAARLDVRLLTPRDAGSDLDLGRIAVQRVGRLTGHAWDQTELALAARGGVLLSLCSTGPLAHGDQVIGLHDAAIYANPENFSRGYRLVHRTLRPRLARRARRVVTVSEFSRGELARYCRVDPERFAVIYNSGEHIRRAPAEPSALAANDLRPGGYLLCFGGASPNKNFAAVLGALDAVERAGLTLAVVGAADASVFAAVGGAGAAERPSVRRLGYVSDGTLRALYENASGFVFPSLYEGAGIPPLEAMSLGCPVIASRSSAIPEVCGEAALYVDPRDPRDLSSAIERLAGDAELRAGLRARGRERAGAYGWAEAARRLADLVTTDRQATGRR